MKLRAFEALTVLLPGYDCYSQIFLAEFICSPVRVSNHGRGTMYFIFPAAGVIYCIEALCRV
jgi:hypothetical protein